MWVNASGFEAATGSPPGDGRTASYGTRHDTRRPRRRDHRPRDTASTPPHRCYECGGTKQITVSAWSDVADDYINIPSTCVCCRGTGYITDGATKWESMQFTPSWINGPECICVHPIDGPMGHPQCPAR